MAAFDVDHIIPQSKARNGVVNRDGHNIPVDGDENLQALCYRCNRAKRDQDEIDLRLPQYKRLVRDRVPDIIRGTGKEPHTRVLDGQLLRGALFDKLVEEHAELIADPSLDEAVDVMEVALSIAKWCGHREAEVMEHFEEKRRERGGFDAGTFLEGIKG